MPRLVLKTTDGDIVRNYDDSYFCRLNLSQLGILEILNIERFINLTQLYLNQNELKYLPSGISALVNLQYLYLDNNSLKLISPEIGALVNLKQLYLNNNQLVESAFPPEIGALTNLQYLFLFNNKLIPPEIGAFINLTHLYVDDNLLKMLPLVLCMHETLTHLQRLDISYNQIIICLINKKIVINDYVLIYNSDI